MAKGLTRQVAGFEQTKYPLQEFPKISQSRNLRGVKLKKTRCPVCGSSGEGFQCSVCEWPIGWLNVPILTVPSDDWKRGVERIISFSRELYNKNTVLKEENKKLKEEIRKRLGGEIQDLLEEINRTKGHFEEENALRNLLNQLREKEIPAEELLKISQELGNLKRNLNKKIKKIVQPSHAGSQGEKIIYYSVRRRNSAFIVKIETQSPPIPALIFIAQDGREPVGLADGREIYRMDSIDDQLYEVTIPLERIPQTWLPDRIKIRPFAKVLGVTIIKS